MPFNNIFNEWYAAQTSKKIRAVWKNKAANGKRVSSSVPFGYVKNPQDKEDWLVDEPAAEVVRKIYALCLDGRGPLQIAKQLEQEKILIPQPITLPSAERQESSIRTIRMGSGNRRWYSCQSAVHGLYRELYDHHGQLQGSQNRVQAKGTSGRSSEHPACHHRRGYLEAGAGAS